MKIYLIVTCYLQLNYTSVKSAHRTREGAVKEMKRQGLIELLQDPDHALLVLDKTNDHIILGWPGTYPEEKQVVICVHEMELQE